MMRWKEHSAYMWFTINIFLIKEVGKRRLGRLKRRDKNNIENNLKEIR
jgi:hypothetical protein